MDNKGKGLIANVRKELSLRKVVAIILLLACMCFIYTQREGLRYLQSYFNGEEVHKLTPKEYKPYRGSANYEKRKAVEDDYLRYLFDVPTERIVSMKGSKTATQTFTAQDSLLRQVRLTFHNPSTTLTEGRVEVSIRDKNGKTIASSSLAANLVVNDAKSVFDFVMSSDALNADEIVGNKAKASTSELAGKAVQKGQKYTVVIKTKKVKTPSEFGLCLGNEAYDDAEETKVAGKTYKDYRFFMGITYIHTTWLIFFVFMFGFLMAILFILLPWQYLSECLGRKFGRDIDLNKWILRIMCVLTPFLLLWMNYKVAGLKLAKILHHANKMEGHLNLLLIGLMVVAIYLICNRTKLTTLLSTAIGFVFAFTNYLLILFRDQPLMATDFSSFGTAMDVAANYTVTFSKGSLWIITVAAIWFLVAFGMRSYKGLPLKGRLAILLITAVWAGSMYYLLFISTFLKDNEIYVSGFKPKWDYENHGYALAFMITATTARVHKPHGYSVEEAEKIMARYQSDPASDKAVVSTKTPNIIVVMNEAFSELKANGDFETKGEYMPYFNSLKENTIRGVLHPSIFGGSTANTEFEFLTGDTTAYMPFHTVPYNNYVKEGMPSLTTTLRDSGYQELTAFHPGMSNSYNRDVVYPNLGFEKFISLEDMKNPKKLRAYVSDDCDFKTIIKEYKKYKKTGNVAPWFMFNVTIQNHSDFKISSGIVPQEVAITDSEVNEEQAVQYLNLIKISDDAFGDLIEYFKTVDEPTVVVMFGDHQPRVGNAFYRALAKRLKGKESSFQIEERKYRVPFVMWANYDIPEQDGVELSANYMAPYLLQSIGGRLTGYDKFLLDLHKTVPVNSAICYKGDDGVLYEPDAESKYSKRLEEYKLVQYNNIIDYKNRVDKFFFLNKGGEK